MKHKPSQSLRLDNKVEVSTDFDDKQVMEKLKLNLVICHYIIFIQAIKNKHLQYSWAMLSGTSLCGAATTRPLSFILF